MQIDSSCIPEAHTYCLQLADLGALISSVINLIPDGVVVFLPSYAFLAKIKEIWQASGLLGRFELRKKVSY